MTEIEKFIIDLFPKSKDEVDNSNTPGATLILSELAISLNGLGISLNQLPELIKSDKNLKLKVLIALETSIFNFIKGILGNGCDSDGDIQNFDYKCDLLS